MSLVQLFDDDDEDPLSALLDADIQRVASNKSQSEQCTELRPEEEEVDMLLNEDGEDGLMELHLRTPDGVLSCRVQPHAHVAVAVREVLSLDGMCTTTGQFSHVCGDAGSMATSAGAARWD